MNYTLKDVNQKANLVLSDIFNRHEISKLMLELIQSRLQISSTHAMAFPDTKVSQSDFIQIEKDIDRLAKHEPIQYVTGKEHFYGLYFEVNPSVLIPRPETEELVQWILDSHNNNEIKVLDIGTGSGCIPISLAKNRSGWKVNALDIDAGALDTAKRNAISNKVNVKFYQADVLNDELSSDLQNLDVLVSNPPYVKQNEKPLMKSNVLDFEPELALFVSDNDPLVFYRKIGELGREILNNEGWIYFEINEQLGEDTANLLEEMGYTNIEVRKDLYNKDRMVRAKK